MSTALCPYNKLCLLLQAGDLTDDLQLFAETLQVFRAKWAHVFWCPGEPKPALPNLEVRATKLHCLHRQS